MTRAGLADVSDLAEAHEAAARAARTAESAMGPDGRSASAAGARPLCAIRTSHAPTMQLLNVPTDVPTNAPNVAGPGSTRGWDSSAYAQRTPRPGRVLRQSGDSNNQLSRSGASSIICDLLSNLMTEPYHQPCD